MSHGQARRELMRLLAGKNYDLMVDDRTAEWTPATVVCQLERPHVKSAVCDRPERALPIPRRPEPKEWAAVMAQWESLTYDQELLAAWFAAALETK